MRHDASPTPPRSCGTRRALRAAAVFLVIACSGDDPVAPTITGLRFVEIPASEIVAGQEFTVSVELLDAGGARSRRARDAVSLFVNSSRPIVGPTSVRAVAGVATFAGLKLLALDTDLLIEVESGTFRIASERLRVRAGPISTTRSGVTPPLTSIVQGDPTPVTVALRDDADNAIAGVEVTLSSPQAGVTFTPASGITGAAGTVNAVLTATGSTPVSINATVNGSTVAIGAPIGVCAVAPFAFPGTVNGTVTQGACVSLDRSTAAYRFTMPTAGGAAFSVTSAFIPPLLEVRTDPVTDNLLLAPPQGQAAQWLLPAGTYQVRVSSLDAGGTFALTGASVAANTGCTIRWLVTGATYSGQALGPGDCQFSEDGSWYDRFVIYSQRPCAFAVISDHFAPWLFVHDHHTLAFLDGRGGGDPGEEERVGFPSCQIQGRPFEVRINADFGFGGPYTFTVTVTGPAMVAAGPGVTLRQSSPFAPFTPAVVQPSAQAPALATPLSKLRDIARSRSGR